MPHHYNYTLHAARVRRRPRLLLSVRVRRRPRPLLYVRVRRRPRLLLSVGYAGVSAC